MELVFRNRESGAIGSTLISKHRSRIALLSVDESSQRNKIGAFVGVEIQLGEGVARDGPAASFQLMPGIDQTF